MIAQESLADLQIATTMISIVQIYSKKKGQSNVIIDNSYADIDKNYLTRNGRRILRSN